MKQLIITADDFGLCTEVNQAVIKAHQNGILTCASLMVAGASAEEAVALAKKNPTLKVGLHLVLVDGFSVLPATQIPDLVDAEGRFSTKIVFSGIRYFFSKKVKNQIAMECEAQIRKFWETGLVMDHINSHNHLHIHPGIREILLPLVFKYKIPAMRLPCPDKPAPNFKSAFTAAVMAPWVSGLKRRLAGTGIAHNQQIFGLHETGEMVEAAWRNIIPRLREGVSEVYCHPALSKSSILNQKMPSYRNEEEFSALISKTIRNELDRLHVIRTSFTALA